MKKMKRASHAARKFSANGSVRKNGATKRSANRPDFKHPKTELEAATQRYADLFELAPIGYVTFDRVGRIEEINLAAAQLLGGSRARLIGAPFALYVTKDDDLLFLNHLLRCRSSDRRVETELHLKKRDGDIILGRLESSPTTSSMRDGARLYQTAILDLTERRRAQEAIRQSEERYRTLFNLGPMAVYTIDTSGVIQEYNRHAAELWGREPALGDTDQRFCGSYKMFRPDGSFMPHDQCPMAEVASGKVSAVHNGEVLIERPDGSHVTVLVNIRPLKNDRGEVTGAINCFYDITDRKRAETAAMRLASVVRSSHDAIVAKDLNGTITDWNHGAERTFGYKAKEIIGKSVLTLIPEERQDEQEEIVRKIRRGESLDHYETVRRRKDGKLIDVSLTISPIKGPKGEIVGVSKIARDITNQKQTERRLTEQARLLDLSNDAIIVRDHQDRVVYWNRGAEEMYGFSAKEALGKITHELLQTTHPENLEKIRKDLERDNHWSGELVHTGKDGKTITVLSRWSLDRDARGRPATILETNTDVTARKRAEQQRRALYQFAQRQYMATNVGEIHDAALDAIVSAMDCRRASILLFDKGNAMRFIAWRGLSERYRKKVESHSPWKPSAKSPQPVCISDVDIADIPKPLKLAMRREGIRAAAFVPLVSSQKLIGKFMAYYDAPRVCTDEELKLATTIAAQIAAAIEHKRDEEALRHSQQQLARELEDVRLLQQTSAQLIHQDEPRAIYEKILDAVVGIMRSEFASIQMFYPKRGVAGELHLLAYRGYTPESAAAWEWIAADHPTTCGMALHTGKRCSVPDVETCDWMAGSKDLAFYRQTGVRSLQSTPLVSRSGKRLGMISTGWKRVHEPSRRDLRLLDVLGRQAADVIERRLAEADVRQKEAELEEIITQTPFMLTRCTRDLRYRYVSHAYAEMLGYEPEQLAGKPIVKFIGKEGLKTILPYVKKVLDGDQVDYEMEVPFKGVGPRWLQCAYTPDRDSDGNVVGWFASLIDVGLRKKAEAVLQQSKEFLEQQVHERTLELHAVNRSLKEEIERRKGLEGEILTVSDREQQRLGQELHDGLCQHLTAVAFMSRSIAMRLKNHRVIEVGDIEKIAQLVNDAASDTRNLSRALHRLDVDAAGLVDALQDLVDREIWRTPCRLEVKPSFRIEDDAAAAHLYRIAREAVINANKHAQARQIVVKVQRSRREMVLRVIDDGVGLSDERKLKKGLGLHIMNYRAQLVGGRLEIESPQTGGTRVSCYLPVHAPRPKKAPNGDEPIEAVPRLSRVPVAGKRTL